MNKDRIDVEVAAKEVLVDETLVSDDLDKKVEKDGHKNGVFSAVKSFFGRYKWLILLIFALLVGVVLFLYNFINVIVIGDTKFVNLDSTTRLETGQILSTKDGNVSVRIFHFSNEVCPAGQVCFGASGDVKSVEYEITVDGKKYATGSVSKKVHLGYGIETVDTDYQTFADIKIVKYPKF